MFNNVKGNKIKTINRNGVLYIQNEYGLVEYIYPKGEGFQCVYYDFEDLIRCVEGTQVLGELKCSDIESKFDVGVYAKRKLYELKVNNPYEYYCMIVENKLQKYVESLHKSNLQTNKTIFKQYKEKYPSMSDVQIQSYINEFNMYDN